MLVRYYLYILLTTVWMLPKSMALIYEAVWAVKI